MKYRQLGQTDVMVSEVGFGMWTLSTGWWGDVTDEDAVKLLQKAHDEYGITLFDAADTYGKGRSELQLAQAFGNKRDKVVYATKVGYDIYSSDEPRTGQREQEQNFSPEHIRFATEQCLKRLNTDYIDVLQMHNVKMEHIENDALFETLDALQQEGKIRTYGVALGPAIGWLAEGVKAIRERNIGMIQVIHNLLEQHPGQAFVDEVHRNGNNAGIFARVPHASGMLEGHYTLETTFEKTDHRSHRPKSWLVNGVKKVEQLRFLEQANRTLGQAALQWLLAEPMISTVLPNIYTAEQLHEFATAVDTPALTSDELKAISELVSNNFGITDEPPMMYKGTMDYPAQKELAAV